VYLVPLIFVPRAVIAGARYVAGKRVVEGVWWRIVKKLMSERVTMSEREAESSVVDSKSKP
jgi:hypothetical protein